MRQAPDDDQRSVALPLAARGNRGSRRLRKEELRGQEDRSGDEKPEAVPGASLPAIGIDGKQDRAQRS
jgi:hypothetical protein